MPFRACKCKGEINEITFTGECNTKFEIPPTTPAMICADCDMICPLNYDPVCGDNGITYSNECLFNVAKSKGEVKEIAFEGDCDNEVVIPPTPQTLSCDMECSKIYKPVCGDNGVTYSNECQFDVAKCNGEVNEITFEGDCDKEVEIQPTTPNVICDLFCSEIYEPVCGDNGETYPNECQFEIAKCNGKVKEITFEGDCDKEEPGKAKF